MRTYCALPLTFVALEMLASFPGYTADTLEEAIQDPDSPMINRALYAYPVGSIFKLVTAACAKDSELADTFQWDCTGTISVEGQLFRCHDDQGHGRQTMPLAMRNSCNPFFIQLSQQLSGAALRQTAKALGFGQEIPLTTGQVASSGTLPTLQQLQLPAERANFGFGQGILTATPLQITRMTCAIAGDGTLPEVRLVRGITEDGRNVLRESSARHSQGISAETAAYLRSLMCYAAADSDFAGKPRHVPMGAKTSTAQTGRFSEDAVCALVELTGQGLDGKDRAGVLRVRRVGHKVQRRLGEHAPAGIFKERGLDPLYIIAVPDTRGAQALHAEKIAAVRQQRLALGRETLPLFHIGPKYHFILSPPAPRARRCRCRRGSICWQKLRPPPAGTPPRRRPSTRGRRR